MRGSRTCNCFSLDELIIVDLVAVIFHWAGPANNNNKEEEEEVAKEKEKKKKKKRNVTRRENENKLTTNDLMGGDETPKFEEGLGSRREANVRLRKVFDFCAGKIKL